MQSDTFTESEQLIHLVELCKVHNRFRSWYTPGTKLLTVCNEMHSDDNGIDDTGISDCLGCIITERQLVCVVCGKDIE